MVISTRREDDRTAQWGSAFGLLAVAFVVILRVLLSPFEPMLFALLQDFTYFASLLTPYLVPFAAVKADPNGKAALLFAACVMSILSLGISLAGIGVIFLPAAVLLTIATKRAIAESRLTPWTVVLWGIPALLAALLIVSALYSAISVVLPYPNIVNPSVHPETLWFSLGLWITGITIIVIVLGVSRSPMNRHSRP